MSLPNRRPALAMSARPSCCAFAIRDALNDCIGLRRHENNMLPDIRTLYSYSDRHEIYKPMGKSFCSVSVFQHKKRSKNELFRKHFNKRFGSHERYHPHGQHPSATSSHKHTEGVQPEFGLHVTLVPFSRFQALRTHKYWLGKVLQLTPYQDLLMPSREQLSGSGKYDYANTVEPLLQPARLELS